ncbi:MAG: RNA polymerase sigma factor [Patescibacteria group bacterium]
MAIKPGGLQEKILVGKLNLKDKDAFSALYDLYLDKIYRFIYFKVPTVAEAEDLTSQVFLKIWQMALSERIKIGESFQSLIYKIARNLVIDHYRSSAQERNSVSLDEAINIARHEELDNKTDVKLEMEKIGQKLRKLKSEYQEIIVMHFIDELTIKEIANILDKKRGNVRVTIHRALKALKEIQ